MTGKEIVKALRCCKFGLPCEKCPVVGKKDCFEEVNTAAAELIERLTAENTVLREKVPRWISVEDRLPEVWINEDDVLHTCLSAAEMRKYANGANGLYGWHISNLRIYDTPRELREFYAVPNEVEVALKVKPKPITSPPQSWRYVEEDT